MDKHAILKRQKHKCANDPDSNLFGLWNFQCPKWTSKHNGHIKKGEYKITNIIDFAGINNRMALCWECYYQKRKISKLLPKFTLPPHICTALYEKRVCHETTKPAGLFSENVNQNRIVGIFLLLSPFLLMGKC
jgi:hypothetical protein